MLGSYARFEHYLTTLEVETCPEFWPPSPVSGPLCHACADRPLLPGAREGALRTAPHCSALCGGARGRQVARASAISSTLPRVRSAQCASRIVATLSLKRALCRCTTSNCCNEHARPRGSKGLSAPPRRTDTPLLQGRGLKLVTFHSRTFLTHSQRKKNC